MGRLDNNKGFTLIEMAIILVIIGLIAGMVLPAIVKSIKREQITKGRRQVRMARDEIIGYVQMHQKLPLDMTKIGHGEDPFGEGYLFYRPAQNIWEGNNASMSICDSSVNSTSLSVKTTTGIIPNVAFVIASRGPNFNLQLYNDTNQVEIFPYGQQIDKYDQDIGGMRVEPFDDIVEFVTLEYLKNTVCSISNSNTDSPPPGSDVSFANNWEEFQKSGGVEPQGKDTISLGITNNEKYISLGNGEYRAWGCYWFPGNSTSDSDDNVNGNCTNGVCAFGNGIRVFFRFKMVQDTSSNSKAKADGFTFALISAEQNDIDVCGGSGGRLGYTGIEIPKIATEIDVYPNNNFNDPNNNHVSFMYWGKNNSFSDDVKHHVPTSPPPPTNCECGGGWIHPDDCCNYQAPRTWLEDGDYHTFRLDIKRDPGSGDINQKAWIDCDENVCRDLRNWFDGSSGYKIEDEVTAVYNGDKLDKIYFGWTVGTGPGHKTQTITIKDFGINFL